MSEGASGEVLRTELEEMAEKPEVVNERFFELLKRV